MGKRKGEKKYKKKNAGASKQKGKIFCTYFSRSSHFWERCGKINKPQGVILVNFVENIYIVVYSVQSTTQQFLKTRTCMNWRLDYSSAYSLKQPCSYRICIRPRPSQPPRWPYSPEVNAGFHAGVSLACGWVTWTRVGVFLFLFFDKRLAHVRRKSQIECSCPPNRVVYNSIELPQFDGGEGLLRICRG
ncbi:hypothetical protein BJ166DRAFT_245393 [Pestalotiopsis sp. NC0098]|nr:hypothetical protein BJ166DRAFT_245393 [Pestalotiopsis sp. NC0098]